MQLYLHVGHGKTGSSFLQSWWTLNRSELWQVSRLHYPAGAADQRARAGAFSMGNGALLDQALQARDRPRQQRRFWSDLLRPMLLSGGATPKGVLFSAERWTRLLPTQLEALLRLADAGGVEQIQIWLLVRDPLDHALSVYGQMVKRHGYSGGLDTWLATYNFPEALLNFLEVFQAMPDRVDLHIDHYGRGKQLLLQRMQDWLQLPEGGAWLQPLQSKVNRSLTADELLLLRWLNRRLGDRSAAVGEQLVDRLPALAPARLEVSRAMHDQFLMRWHSCLDRINQRLPNSAQLQLSWPEPFAEAVGDVEESVIRLSREQLDCLLDGLSTWLNATPSHRRRDQLRSWFDHWMLRKR